VVVAVVVVVYGFGRRAVWSVVVTTVTGSRAPDSRSSVVTKTITTLSYRTDTTTTHYSKILNFNMIYDLI